MAQQNQPTVVDVAYVPDPGRFSAGTWKEMTVKELLEKIAAADAVAATAVAATYAARDADPADARAADARAADAVYAVERAYVATHVALVAARAYAAANPH
jgi:hypothetical protein